MKTYKATLRTGGKTRQQIIATSGGYAFTETEIENTLKFYNLLDGAIVFVSEGIDGGYYLVEWTDEEQNRMKEAIYLIEQDALFGTYVGQREEFDKDWDAGEYSPDGIICFDACDVEIKAGDKE